jgi:biotin carboxyl carrier protein
MDFEIIISERTRKVSIEKVRGAEGLYTVRVSKESGGKSGREATLQVLHANGPVNIISLNHKAFFVREISASKSSIEFTVEGRRYVAYSGLSHGTVGRGMTSDTQSGVASVGEIVTANFPAKVIKIQATPKTKLDEGETIMVLEAMKMEAQIKTPSDSVVQEIYVKEGDMVERGRKLAKLEFRRKK